MSWCGQAPNIFTSSSIDFNDAGHVGPFTITTSVFNTGQLVEEGDYLIEQHGSLEIQVMGATAGDSFNANLNFPIHSFMVTASVPEPSSLALVISGSGLLALLRRRKQLQ